MYLAFHACKHFSVFTLNSLRSDLRYYDSVGAFKTFPFNCLFAHGHSATPTNTSSLHVACTSVLYVTIIIIIIIC